MYLRDMPSRRRQQPLGRPRVAARRAQTQLRPVSRPSAQFGR
jgi:hypothetical protein